ncbi:MAG: EAL domain-containing protein [Sulfuricurvum sp.]|uniref:EAL domain-containing protein n=1 Tax=Sulfuricurvum sp. TaxID=2025608 RepID=UPI00261B1C9C|nr:EAL domain-containing protein [Sulfuricurvum sp.]MDD2828090.1 EAL domain-containing protein [Sulfuricurvum sp.]MDD4948036.1 EAL domain-containing protein [Sulfuricurvum sp.]
MKQVTLETILSHKVITLNSSDTIVKALELMTDYAISSVVITDDEKRPIGIFTEHDALKVVAEAIETSTELGEVMTQNPFCVVLTMQMHDAYALMEEKHFRHLIVVDKEGYFAGVITEGDFLRHIGLEHLTKFKTVGEAMSESPLIVELQTTLVEAAVLMNERKCDYAIVLRGVNPIGVITERDIAHRCAKDSCVSEELVEDLFHSDIVIVEKEIALHHAASMMEEHGVHQLIVVDALGSLSGILTRHDVLHAVHGAYFEYLIRVIDEKSAAIARINERKRILGNEKKEIEKNETKLRKLFEALPDSILLIDRETLRAVEFNQAAHEHLGYTAEEFGELCIDDYESIELPDETQRRIDVIMREGKDRFETIHRGKDGRLYNVWVNVVAVELDKHPYMIAVYHDITERKKYEERLEILANFDPLTGLANRARLLSHLQNSINQAKRHKSIIALMMFDLDRFKDINDSYGHSAGDEVLKLVAERFASRLREGDLIARLGGDEFAIVVENLDRFEDAGRLAQEMISALALEYKLSSGSSVHIGASVGIVLFPEHGGESSVLLQHADAALYKAKDEGRGTYRYYTDELTESARRRIECEMRLRRAVTNNEFEVYYQPQVHILTGHIVGAEALVRWNDPIRGIVSPAEFIPIAEETGLIGEIGEWVLNETCRQGKIWLDQGHRLTLAVNLSAHQVRHQNIIEMVEYALKQSGYPADRLELELTESALMQHEEETVAMLHSLRARGIRLAIDDFGTGYSSLSYLKRFPIDVLKIDKSFVDDLPFEKDDMAIVTAIIAMAQALGFQVLAEGTERIEQIEFLKERGCTMYQGYFKSEPVPAAEFEKLL